MKLHEVFIISCKQISASPDLHNVFVHLISKDIDECQMDEGADGGCQQVCTNTDGSFICSCNSGFALKADQQTCESKHFHSVTSAV